MILAARASLRVEVADERAPGGPNATGGMQVRIHRGAEEIGGSCVEVEYRGSRIVLDVGKPLWAGWDEAVPLPAVPGLAEGSDPALAGVIITHPHLDHFGLIGQVHPRVPVYVGREAALLLAESEFFSSAGATLHPTGFLAHRVPLRVGAFTVTPYLADHSGFDAYSLLVEAGGNGSSTRVTSGATAARLACSTSCCPTRLRPSTCCSVRAPISEVQTPGGQRR